MDLSVFKQKSKVVAEQAAQKLVDAFNRADEFGGDVRDYITGNVLRDKRVQQVRQRLDSWLGRADRETDAAQVTVAEVTTAVVGVAPVQPAVVKGALGDPSIKAQIYGRKSCPWTGRAITLLERHKVDNDFIDLDDGENEKFIQRLHETTSQSTVPYVYLRGQFIGGFHALSEIERLGQLDVALMSVEERAAAPAHIRNIEIVARPNTDEHAAGEGDRDDNVGDA